MLPKGMELMFKAMGIDAQALMGGYKEAALKFQQTANYFDASLKRIEANQAKIMNHLGIEGDVPLKAVENSQEKGTGTNG